MSEDQNVARASKLDTTSLSDALDRLGATGPDCEIAAHGDVHRGFADARTNLARVDRMLETFRAAGLTPRGSGVCRKSRFC